MYFTEIRPTRHYLEEHASVPWDRVVELILTCKSPRKTGSTFVIEKGGNYIVFRIENNILYVINAK